MGKLVNELYSATRLLGKAASTLNDVENISKGNYEKIAKKHIKRQAHKVLNKSTLFK